MALNVITETTAFDMAKKGEIEFRDSRIMSLMPSTFISILSKELQTTGYDYVAFPPSVYDRQEFTEVFFYDKTNRGVNNGQTR